MSFLKILLFCFFLINVSTSTDTKDLEVNNVLALTNSNFDKTIANNKYILVLFYAPWCGYCKAIAPEYVKASTYLKEKFSEVVLAKVDITSEKELKKRFNIKEWPFLKYFNGSSTPTDAINLRTSGEICLWLKKNGPGPIFLKNVEQLTNFKDSNDVVVVGLFDSLDNKNVKTLNDMSRLDIFDLVYFAISTKKSIYTELNLLADNSSNSNSSSSEHVVLFKKFDEGRNDFVGEFVEDDVKRFIQLNQLELITEYNQVTSHKLFGGKIKVHNFLFASKQNESFETILSEFKEAAKVFRGRAIFVLVDSDVDENGRVLEFFGLKKEDSPTIRLINNTLTDVVKFKPHETEITASVVTKFVQDFFDDKLKKDMLSQELPADWDSQPVKVLVGNNFEKIARDRSKSVLVEFYAPWCGACKQFEPTYLQLAENFRFQNDFVVAKIDATANEVENIRVENYPTIKLFPKDSDEVIDYIGERKVDKMTKFLKSHGKQANTPAKKNEEEEGEEEEEEEEEEEKKDEL